MNYIKDDLISVINAVIDRRIQGLVTYRGKVQRKSSSGYVYISCNELNITEDKSDSFLLVGNGISHYNFISPDIGDEVEFYFIKGDNSDARYINIIRKQPLIPINELNKYVLEYKDFLIYHDIINDCLKIKSGSSEIIINNSGSIDIEPATELNINSNTGINIKSNGGLIPLEKSILGESLKDELDKVMSLLTELQTQISAWTPVALDGGSALKANLAGFQSMDLPDFSNILSMGTKNN